MPAVTRDKPAAWRFIEFANSPAGQEIIAASGRTVPSLRAVAESPAFLDPRQRPASSQVFLDAIPTIRPLPVLAGWADIEAILDEELTRAYYGQASLDEAIRTAEERAGPFFAPCAAR